MKQLINNININKYSYLKILLVLNKFDLVNERTNSNLYIKKYLENNKLIETQEISVKNGNNIQNLIEKINIALNNMKNKLPSNLIYESSIKNAILNNMNTRNLHFLLLGDKYVGKTVFFNEYFHKKYKDPMQRTVGLVKNIKYIKIDNMIYKLTLIDSSGSKIFRNILNDKYIYENIDGILLFFDVTNENTFSIIPKFIQYIKENSDKKINDDINQELSIFLIGNKIDKLNRVISKEKAEDLAESLGIKYFEISSIINMNINEVMAKLIMECHMRVNKINNFFIQPNFYTKLFGIGLQPMVVFKVEIPDFLFVLLVGEMVDRVNDHVRNPQKSAGLHTANLQRHYFTVPIGQIAGMKQERRMGLIKVDAIIGGNLVDLFSIGDIVISVPGHFASLHPGGEGIVKGVSISDGSPSIVAEVGGKTYQVAISDVTRIGEGTKNT